MMVFASRWVVGALSADIIPPGFFYQRQLKIRRKYPECPRSTNGWYDPRELKSGDGLSQTQATKQCTGFKKTVADGLSSTSDKQK